MHLLALIAQVVIACSIVYVWVTRFPHVVNEFHEYGLSDSIRSWVGATKIVLATFFVAALWYPALAKVPALLMACGLVAHYRVHRTWQKYVPAVILLILNCSSLKYAHDFQIFEANSSLVFFRGAGF
jgi:hypothetical protein